MPEERKPKTKKMIITLIALTTIGVAARAINYQNLKIENLKKEMHKNFKNLDKYLNEKIQD